jgi:hypothetical protein
MFQSNLLLPSSGEEAERKSSGFFRNRWSLSTSPHGVMSKKTAGRIYTQFLLIKLVKPFQDPRFSEPSTKISKSGDTFAEQVNDRDIKLLLRCRDRRVEVLFYYITIHFNKVINFVGFLIEVTVNLFKFCLMRARFRGEQPERSPRGLHRTEIESTDFIEIFSFLKSR